MLPIDISLVYGFTGLSVRNISFKCILKGEVFLIDLIIGISAILVVAFAIINQFKLYKKNGISSFCGGDCMSCRKNCYENKS